MSGIAAVVTVSSLNEVEIRKAYEMGAQAVIVPHVHTKADMLEVIGAAKFPNFPNGRRSFDSSVRAAHYGGLLFDSKKFIAECERTEMVIPTCDSKDFLKNIDDILSVEGIDAVAFAPVDFALSENANDFDVIDYDRDDLSRALDILLDKCAGRGLRVVLPVWPATYEKVQRLVDRGCNMLTIGSDTRDFARAASKIKETLVDPLLKEFA